MSQTFKIATVAATDPIREAWEQINAPVTGMMAQRCLSRFRSVVLEFNTLTTAQYAQWLAVCDIDATNAPYLPERVDAAYATSPEAFTGTPIYTGSSYTTPYRYHFLGSRHSAGADLFIYDTRIELYMIRDYTYEAGTGN